MTQRSHFGTSKLHKDSCLPRPARRRPWSFPLRCRRGPGTGMHGRKSFSPTILLKKEKRFTKKKKTVRVCTQKKKPVAHGFLARSASCSRPPTYPWQIFLAEKSGGQKSVASARRCAHLLRIDSDLMEDGRIPFTWGKSWDFLSPCNRNHLKTKTKKYFFFFFF